MKIEDLISINEAAEIANVSTIGLRTWTGNGILTLHRVGGHPVVDKNELLKLLRFRRTMNCKKWKEEWIQFRESVEA